MSEQWRVGEALREASSFLQQHVDSLQRLPQLERVTGARHEAEILIGHVLGMSRTRLLTSSMEPVADTAWQTVRSGLALRAAGTPLQYIVGEAPFWGRLFCVRPGCLVPRPETEILVEAALAWLGQTARRAPVVVDIGTGSGAIAVTLSLEAPHAQVHAVDVSAAAMAIAQENAARFDASVTFHDGDAFVVMRRGDVPGVNLLVSNPPYIPSADIAGLDEEVRCHEPQTALDGGTDGLDFYRWLAAEAPNWLVPGPSALLLEVGSGQAEGVIAAFRNSAGWDEFAFTVLPDLRGIGRVVQGLRR